MPRYHFQARNGAKYSDPSGAEFSGVQAARIAAAQLFGQILSGEAEVFWKDPGWEMMVTDDRGLILFKIHISATDAPVLGGRMAANIVA